MGSLQPNLLAPDGLVFCWIRAERQPWLRHHYTAGAGCGYMKCWLVESAQHVRLDSSLEFLIIGGPGVDA